MVVFHNIFEDSKKMINFLRKRIEESKNENHTSALQGQIAGIHYVLKLIYFQNGDREIEKFLIDEKALHPRDVVDIHEIIEFLKKKIKDVSSSMNVIKYNDSDYMVKDAIISSYLELLDLIYKKFCDKERHLEVLLNKNVDERK